MFKLNHFSYSLGFFGAVLDLEFWSWDIRFPKEPLAYCSIQFPCVASPVPCSYKTKKCYIFKAPLLLSGSEINIGQNI